MYSLKLQYYYEYRLQIVSLCNLKSVWLDLKSLPIIRHIFDGKKLLEKCQDLTKFKFKTKFVKKSILSHYM